MSAAKAKPAHGGNRERAEREKAAALAVSTSNPNNKFTMRRGLISSVLSEGKENALTGREIVRILGLKDGRDVTSMIEQERRGGAPICARCDKQRPGYFLAETPEELSEYIQSLHGRIKEVAATRDAMEAVLCEWIGQRRIDMGVGATE